MQEQRIAVPAAGPEGLAASRSDHFGHCHSFAIVSVVDGVIQESKSVNNPGHGAGGCQAPLALLQRHQVTAMVVAGMGARPLQAFSAAGIKIFWGPRERYQSVASVVEGLVRGELAPMEPVQACQGHDCHQSLS